MARLPDLEQFAAVHRLKIATISDLVQYRLRHDSLVHRVAEARLPTRFGEFRAIVFRSDVDDCEHLVLLRGEVDPHEPVLVRVHAEYLSGDVFGHAQRNTGEVLHQAMRLIHDVGSGVILYLRRDATGDRLPDEGAAREQSRPSTSSGRLKEFRDYGIGAQILRDVGVRKIRLLTNYPRRFVSLPGYGLEIVECVPLTVEEPGRPADGATGNRIVRSDPENAI
jgi:3,4-dihydroxy 2-butanone 4-phosphate synthase/GTP cyclohydrolase II